MTRMKLTMKIFKVRIAAYKKIEGFSLGRVLR
nr:MAG TPA: hypothetical protein [Caudoviricetes sp.]